jgi:hypothetical protein
LIDVIGKQTRSAVGEVDSKEKPSAANEIAPVVSHRRMLKRTAKPSQTIGESVSTDAVKQVCGNHKVVVGNRSIKRWVSLRSTHPTNSQFAEP